MTPVTPMRRLSIRARLTLVYGGLVLLTGVLLLAVTALLVSQRLSGTAALTTGVRDLNGTGQAVDPGTVAGEVPAVRTGDGEVVTVQDLPGFVHRSAMESLLTQGGIALLVVTAIAVAFAWLIAGRSLQPLQRITDTARRIGGAPDGPARGLHERIALEGPADEVKHLADTFDAMLERLDRSFDGQRRFVANASHELRTPLAINRALIELAVTHPTASADCRRLGDSLLTINARHERLIDGLLTLAESENAIAERTPVDLADIAEHVVAAVDGTVQVRDTSLRPAPTAGDPVLLERLVQNLVDNAVRHNLPGGWVTVVSHARDGQAMLTVSNTGPVVPPYEVETLFQPFRRQAGQPGSRLERGFGLGLPIVRAVAQAHQGAVTASPRPGGGLVVTLTLPLLADDAAPEGDRTATTNA